MEPNRRARWTAAVNRKYWMEHVDLQHTLHLTCKTYSSLHVCLQRKRAAAIWLQLLLGLPCSCSGHTTQIQSSQLQPRVLEESPTTFENADREHALKMLLLRDGIGYTGTSAQPLATKTYLSILLYILSCSFVYGLGVAIR